MSRDHCLTDVPDAPTAPCVRDVHSSGCTVTYQSPVFEGATAVIGYLLECKTTTCQSWVPLSAHLITGTSVKIRELRPSTGYEFRVAAVNFDGVGKFSPVSAAITTDHNRPVQPGCPTVRTVWIKSIDLEWTMPCDDGEKFHYIILIHYHSVDTDGRMFVATERKAGPVVRHSMSVEMKREVFYDFAVAAVNAAGVGPYSITSERVRFLTGKSHFNRQDCVYSWVSFRFFHHSLTHCTIQ